MAELKATVGVLRADGDAPRLPVAGLAATEDLFALVRDAGLCLDAEVIGRPRPLPAAVDRAAYRILQESLTNVLRHAHAGRVTVTVRYQPAAVVIEVTDDGRGSAEQGIGQPGHGIAGMTERAAALRGSLQAGRTSDGGFRTLAVLPTDAAAP